MRPRRCCGSRATPCEHAPSGASCQAVASSRSGDLLAARCVPGSCRARRQPFPCKTAVSGAPTKPIVLVPGACLGGWCWRAVAARLRAAGHDVYPLTLTGLGEGRISRDQRWTWTHTSRMSSAFSTRGSSRCRSGRAQLRRNRDHGRRRPGPSGWTRWSTSTPLASDGTAIVDVQPSEQREQQRQGVARAGEGCHGPVPDRETFD